MSVLETIKSWLRIGGAKVGMVNELTKITDHPRIGVSPEEYDRIDDDLKYFKGKFPKVKYRDTYGADRKRDYISLNMAQVICRNMASILVNENMSIGINDNESALTFVQDIFDRNDFNKNIERYLESGLALGGLGMRPYLDGDTIKIAYVQAPVFYPLRSNTGDVSEAAIASRSTTVQGRQPIYWTLLEFHSWAQDGKTYVIDNELYRSDNKDRVGVRVNLGMMYPDLSEHVELPDLKRPLFVYFKPFGFNNKDITSPLGLSIYDNARATLRAINDAYDQFHWEIKAGQRRMAVPERMTKIINEAGQDVLTFPVDQDVFVSVGGDMDDAKITDMTPDIRVDRYTATLNELLRKLETQVGLSAGALSPNLAQANKTATEVVSEDSLTYRTRSSHLTNVERAIQELVVSILELAEFYDLYSGDIPDVGDVVVNFDDGVFTDKNAQLDYYTKAAAAGFISKKDAIMKVMGKTDTEASEILKQIQAESQPPMSADDANMYGGAD